MRGPYRHTKIIATVGPATEGRDRIAQLILAGVDVIRLNMAHATGEWVVSLVKRVREVSAEVKRHVAVMMDVKGPEIRTGDVAEPVELGAGDTFQFYTEAHADAHAPTPGDGVRGVRVNYAGFPADGGSGIVVFTRSGFLAYTLAALRAVAVPVYAFTDDEALFRQLLLPWGVEPFLMPFSDDPEETIRDALAYLKRREWCDRGNWLVVITNALAREKVLDTIQLRQIE